MSELFVEYWAKWALGLAAGALALFWKKGIYAYKERKRKKAASDFSDRYVLFMKLREIHRDVVDSGVCTSEDLIEAEETYKHYHDGLHGNGRGDVYIEDIRAIHEANLEYKGGLEHE